MKTTLKTILLAATLIMSASTVYAQAEIMPCDPRGKSLYRDISIYYMTKDKLEDPVIGNSLRRELNSTARLAAFHKMSLHEKVHTIATSFAKCHMNLTKEEIQADDEIAAMAIEMDQKRKNPYNSEE